MAKTGVTHKYNAYHKGNLFNKHPMTAKKLSELLGGKWSSSLLRAVQTDSRYWSNKYNEWFKIVKAEELVWMADKDGIHIEASTTNELNETINADTSSIAQAAKRGGFCHGWAISKEWKKV